MEIHLEQVARIQRVTAEFFGIRREAIVGPDRHKTVALARHVAMYLCKKRLAASYPELGAEFGDRDHTTIMSGVRKIASMREKDPEMRELLDRISSKLGGRTRALDEGPITRTDQLDGIEP